ncbi:MAG TPA: hypothetical protein DCG75_11870 [Bacteroidales bacterium]|jgi:hypothetical protein|nr:hypothetical protein [Bacteroidales bacterium]
MIKPHFSLNRRLKRYFAEMTLIILSVLLAFILNELRNNHIENKNLITSLEFIKEEVSQNQLYINEIINVHKKVIENIDSLLINEKFHDTFSPEYGFSYFNIYKKSFFNQLLSNDAWNIANNNNVFDKMNIREVVILSSAYEQQQHVMRAAWDINDFLLSEAIFDEERTETNCKILRNKFKTLLGLEIRICYNYEEAIKTLSKLTD